MLPRLMCGVAELQVPLLVELGEGEELGRGALRRIRVESERAKVSKLSKITVKQVEGVRPLMKYPG